MAPNRNGRSTKITFQPAGLEVEAANQLVGILQDRLVALIDLSLTIKHVHWNVVGPHFIGVHQMLDPQAAAVGEMIDETAERITTLGGSPNGLPGHLVASRSWDDYALGRDLVDAHLGALDQVYTGVIVSHRDAIDATEKPDPVTQDMLIEHTSQLEQFHWFVRAHLENAAGQLADAGDSTEKGAAASATAKTDAPKDATKSRAAKSGAPRSKRAL